MRRGREPAEALEVLYGLRSGLAVFSRRREDIRAISYAPALRSELRELLAWAAAQGAPATVAQDKELARLADSTQHEGLVLEVKPRRWLAAKELPGWLVTRQQNAVAFDRVRNPQNIGAILRSAAFFGFGSAILGAPAPHPGLPAFAIRIAEGGAEHLAFTRTTDLAESLSRLRSSGVRVIGTDVDAPVDVQNLSPRRPSVVVVGNEREGLTPRIRAQCDVLVAIRGSGAVQSLNVAVAAGVVFAALARGESASRN
jgi:RNA methyltransferase, TrmH family